MSPRPVQQAPFRVLVGANMPAVLVEIGYLSNPDQEKALASGGYQDRIAQGALRRHRRVSRQRRAIDGGYVARAGSGCCTARDRNDPAARHCHRRHRRRAVGLGWALMVGARRGS